MSRTTALAAVCLSALVGACGSGSPRRLASGASTSIPAGPVGGAGGAVTSAPAPATATTGPPTTRPVATTAGVSAAGTRTTLPPTTVPRSATTTAPRSPTTAPAGYSFHERDYSFDPSTFSVAAGTRVTIVNQGPSYHTWTSDAGAWDSGTLAPGATYSYTFTARGTFTFKCTIHPIMQGTVTVT